MKIYEQIDKSGENLYYSWLLCVPYRTKLPDGWKWTRGRPGCFVTMDRELAMTTATSLQIVIESNGTHAIHGFKLGEYPLTF